MHFYMYVQIHLESDFIKDTVKSKSVHNLNQDSKKQKKHYEFVVQERRTRCHGNQSLSSSSNTFPRFSLFLRPLRSSANILTTGCIPPLPRASTLMCLFPKRPMGLTPRPTYQNGSISGPGHHRSTDVAFAENRKIFF